MDWQIVDPDPGLNYNVVILTSDLHLKMEKIYITAVQIMARLWIVMLHDTVLSLKIMFSFGEIWITNNPKMFWLPLKLSQKSLGC